MYRLMQKYFSVRLAALLVSLVVITTVIGATTHIGAAMSAPPAAPDVLQIPGANPPGSTLTTCSALALEALTALEQNCTALGANSACYGYRRVGATFTQETAPDFFSQPADRAEVVTLQSITTDVLNEETGDWGVALMSVQANLPGTLPGQAVTFVLMGDATVVNAVSPDEAALPVDPITIVAAGEAPLRTQPSVLSNAVTTVPAGATLAADAVSGDGAWVRVVYVAPDDTYGGWFPVSQQSGDLSRLPTITPETRSPMQSFLFRTGVGGPVCDDAPDSVVIQGPTNTEVTLNVNGADFNIGSTIQLNSVAGAPQAIIDSLNLPPEVVARLQGGTTGDPGGQQCAIMQLSVINGAVRVNEGANTLPEGNTAYAVFCAQEGQTIDQAFTDQALEATEVAEFFQPDFSLQNGEISFASAWGGFRELTDEEIDELAPLELIPEDVLNYPIELPEQDEQEATATPQPTATDVPISTAVPTTVPTAVPTASAGVPSVVTVNPAADNQTSTVGQPFAVPFSITAVDANGQPAANAPITFAAPSSGASGTFAATGTNTQTVLTDSNGVATTSAFTGNTVAGTYNIVAQAGTVAASADPKFSTAKVYLGDRLALQSNPPLGTFTASNTAAAASVVQIVSGGNQTARVGENFSLPFVIQVSDVYGNGVANQSVTLNAPASGASLSQTSYTGSTGSTGQYTASVASPNTVAGSYTVAVTSGTLSPATFTLTNAPGIATQAVLLAGNGQSATVNGTFGTQLRARALDTYGNPVANTEVTFVTPQTSTSASGVFTASSDYAYSVFTNASGEATASPLQANTVAGTFAVQFLVNGSPAPQQFTLTNLPGAAAQAVIVAGDDQSAPVNTAFANNLVARVTDEYGNGVPGISVTFAAPSWGEGASGTFASTEDYAETVTSSSSGLATASVLTADSYAGSFSVSVQVGGENWATFDLDVTAGAPANLYVYSGDNQTTTIGTAFAEAPELVLTDSAYNGVAGETITFSLPLTGASATFPGGENTWEGTTDADGGITLPTLTANTVAGSYTLTASGPNSTSAIINLTNAPGAPATISIIQGSPQSTTVGNVFDTILDVRVLDSFGNPIAGEDVTFTAPASGASATFDDVNPYTAATDSGGYLQVFGIANTIAGSYSVSVTAGSASANLSLTNTPEFSTASLVAISGENQSTTVNTAFAPLIIEARDQYGNPISGKTVTFTANLGTNNSAAEMNPSNPVDVVTNANGRAQTTPTANTNAGTHFVDAVSDGQAYNFYLTNTPDDPASLIVVSGDGQQTLPGTAFANDVVLTVEDTYGNPIPDVPVNFSFPATGASASITSGTTTTDANGTITVTLTANDTAGTYNVPLAVEDFPAVNNQLELENLLVALPTIADLVVTGISVDNPNPTSGSVIIYSITVRNDGPGDITSPDIYGLRFNPPFGTSYVTHSADPATHGYNGWYMQIYNLLSGQSTSLSVTVQVTAGSGAVISETTAQEGGTVSDPTPGNNEVAYPTVTVQ